MFGRQYEYGSIPVPAAAGGCAKKIPSRILDQGLNDPADRTVTMCTEIVDHLVSAIWGQLVNDTPAVGAPLGRCAIKVSVLSLDWRQRERAVLAVGKQTKGVQDLEFPGWADPKEHSVIRFASVYRRPVEIPIKAQKKSIRVLATHAIGPVTEVMEHGEPTAQSHLVENSPVNIAAIYSDSIKVSVASRHKQVGIAY